MKTIKIIDLINKIANKDEVPNGIKKEGKTYKYNGSWEDYYCELDDVYFFQTMLCRNKDMSLILNDEVEIIEEEKEIETIDMSSPISVVHCAMKINELIDAVNELKKDKQSCHTK